MSRWRNNGGWNKSHGSVEKTPRVDSFELGKDVRGWGRIFCGGKFIEAYHVQEDGECCLFLPGDTEPVEIVMDYKENGFGGNQAFFLCPACGERRRYLYLTGSTFLCRKCAKLNYQSQQETRSGSMYYYHKGMDLVDRRLYTWPRFRPDGFTFCGWVPDRPRYMHQTTYRRYLWRFLRYQKKHEDRQLAELRALLGPKAWAEIERLQYGD